MAFELFINGADFTDYFVRQSLVVTEALQANGQTMQVQIVLPTSSSLTPPQGGNEIVFLKDGNKEFAGRINRVEQLAPINSQVNTYALDCVDYTADLDRVLLQTDIAPGTAGDAVRTVLALVGNGFTSNNVVNGPQLQKIEVRYESPSSVISRIAESIEHQWYVDYDRDVNFFFILDRPAPLDTVNLDTDTDTYFNCVVSEDWSQVKNVIYLTGAKAKSSNSYTQSFTGNGSTRFFPLAYEPWSLSTTTVSINGVNQNLLLDSVDGFAGSSENAPANSAAVCLDNWGVRIPSNLTPPGNGVPVNITYNYAYEPVVVVEDPDSIALMRQRENTATAPSDGRHMFKFNVPDMRVDSEETIYEYGLLLLRRYAKPILTVRFSSWFQGWRAGQNFHVYSSPTMRNVDAQVFIKSVSKRILKSSDGQARLFYDVTATNSPFPG